MKRFSLYVEMDWSTLTCPCGASCRTDEDRYDEWRSLHASHTDDNGASALETNDPSSWNKCFSGTCPPPRVTPLVENLLGPGESEYVIGFGPTSIPADETAVFKATLKDDFSDTRLIVPSALANSFSINGVRVGEDSQTISANPIPAAAFSELAIGVNLGLKKAKKGDDIELHVSNTTQQPQTFSAELRSRPRPRRQPLSNSR